MASQGFAPVPELYQGTWANVCILSFCVVEFTLLIDYEQT